MDKNKIIGVLLLVAALGAFYFSAPTRPPPSASPAASVAGQAAPATSGNAAPVATPATPTAPVTIAPLPAATLLAAVVKDHADATLTTLANSKVTVRLTDFGGAVLDVAFKDYPAEQDKPDVPYVFNAQHAAPILAFTDFPGLDQNTRFERVPNPTPNVVVYRAVLENRLEVTRRYTLPSGDGDATHDPYRIRHETTFRVLPDKPGTPPTVAALSLGTAAPISAGDFGQYLNVARYDGSRANHIDRGQLQGGGLLAGLGLASNPPKSELRDDGPAIWGAVKNQFFASIYTPDKPGSGVLIRRVELAPFAGSTQPNIGITGALLNVLPALTAGAPPATLGGELYVGPKEYTRLKEFASREDKVMQFDSNWYTRLFLSGYVAPLMNTLMNAMHRVVGNWGLAIILMTLLLKFVSLPFTLAASRSAKRMQKLQPLMAAMREKYKDNPQKLNTATMELFKEHKVNPVGGCLPILITIPLFIGFFNMLQGTAELRFQGFLWARDLSGPDTIGRLGGFAINIMPLLMGATMFYQMKLTPQPTVDNAQAKMFKFMPFFFTLICYNFSCALALYSTINGGFTIVQQLLVNKYAKVDDTALATTGPGGRPVKNVTPKKKK